MNLTKQHAESTPMPSSLEYQLPSATVGGMDAASLPHTLPGSDPRPNSLSPEAPSCLEPNACTAPRCHKAKQAVAAR